MGKGEERSAMLSAIARVASWKGYDHDGHERAVLCSDRQCVT